MADKFKFASLAQKELEDSSKWYETQLLGLGERFAETIYEAVAIIVKKPETYPVKKSKRHQYVVNGYPFVIIYEYLKMENLVHILHIFHTSRNPKLKYKKK